MSKIQGLDKMPTGYSDKLTAEHFILWNKLKKQLKEDKSLNPEEKTIIADKLTKILEKYSREIWTEESELSHFSGKIKYQITEAIQVEKLKSRNHKGYTENDIKVMIELEEKHPDKYKRLVLDHKIEFTKEHITIYYAWKFQYDREDLKTPTLKKEKMTYDKAVDIAKKQGKIVDYRFHNLAEEFWNKFVVNLFQLKDWEYHTGYSKQVQQAKKFWKNVSVPSCDPFSSAYTSDTKEVESDYKAYVRLCKDLRKHKWGWSITIIS